MKHLIIPFPILVAALAAMMSLATSCTGNIIREAGSFVSENMDVNDGTSRFDYPNAEKYLCGSAAVAEKVRELSIDWFDGEIEFAVSDNDTLYVDETFNGPQTDQYRMRWYLEPDGELHVAFVQKGEYKSSELNKLRKRLTLRVPRGMQLEDVNVDGVNATLIANSLLCRSLDCDCVNFTLKGRFAVAPEDISVDAVNATIDINLPETTVLYIDKDCVNSDIHVGLPAAEKKGRANCQLDIDCVNARVYVNTKK